MSFEDSSRLESQPAGWRSPSGIAYSDDPAFSQLVNSLCDSLLEVNSNVRRLSQLVALLGTKRENDKTRERVNSLLDQIGGRFMVLAEEIKSLSAMANLNPYQKFTQQKLNREFQAAICEFQVLQRKAIEKERISASAALEAMDKNPQEDGSPSARGNNSDSNRAAPDWGRQAQAQESPSIAPPEEVSYQANLIMQREAEIRNIEQSVSDLNELFRDVAHMIHEQGEQLDIISENVEGIRDSTRGAHVELKSAAKSMKKVRNRSCCLMVILAVVFTIIVLAILAG